MLEVEIRGNGKELAVKTEDGGWARFHAVWLRDNAMDEVTRAASNGQRLIRVQDIPENTIIESLASSSIAKNKTVQVTFTPDNTSFQFDIDWLLSHRYDQNTQSDTAWLDEHIEVWDSSTFSPVHDESPTPSDVGNRLSPMSEAAKGQRQLPFAEYSDLLSSSEALFDWLVTVRNLGFNRVHNGPVTPEAILQLTQTFGYVRETNYGQVFDVRSMVNPENLAYTNLGLQAHTDNPYRDPVPTLQILYCLENSTDGGESMLVDGFKVAMQLRAENQEWFEILSQYPARFQYEGMSGVNLHSKKTLIELSPDAELVAIRFNNRSIAPTVDVPFDLMELWYSAYRRFGELVDDPAMQIEFRLQPGECFIVDNTRILHARQAFSGHGSRWLRGCYPDKDGLLSTIATLEKSLTV